MCGTCSHHGSSHRCDAHTAVASSQRRADVDVSFGACGDRYLPIGLAAAIPGDRHQAEESATAHCSGHADHSVHLLAVADSASPAPTAAAAASVDVKSLSVSHPAAERPSRRNVDGAAGERLSLIVCVRTARQITP